MTRSRLSIVSLVVLAALALSSRPSAAAEAQRPWFDTYSRIVFSFNQAVYDQLHAWSGPPREDDEGEPVINPVVQGIGRMASNIVNEPMSVLAALVAGDPVAAVRATGRFALNSTVGLLGYYDPAAEWGLMPYHTDLGLALCAHGVGEGPYMVIPFIGPRTLRDGLTDVVLTNLILYSAAQPFLPPNSGLQTILMVESVEIVADIAATRQIDPKAKAINFDDFEGMREAYLAQRRARCDALKTAE